MNSAHRRKMRVGLVRHGETDWNREGRVQGSADRPLSARGRVQISDLGDDLRGQGWERIVSSPLLRAAESARLLCKALELRAPELEPRFAERCYGPAEGLQVASAKVLYPEHASVPGREEVPTFRRRVVSALTDVGHLDCDAVLVVTHGEVIAALLDHLGRFVPRVLEASVHEVKLDR